MSYQDYEYASLSHNAMDKLQELESSLSTYQRETNPGEEVIVIAFKKKQ